MNEHLFTPTTHQRNNIAKVQLDEPVSLLGLLTGVWVRVYLQDIYNSKTAASLKAPHNPAGVTTHEPWCSAGVKAARQVGVPFLLQFS